MIDPMIDPISEKARRRDISRAESPAKYGAQAFLILIQKDSLPVSPSPKPGEREALFPRALRISLVILAGAGE